MSNVIYEPKGKALEYAPLACNLYEGCGHGCLYCYAPDVLKKTRDEFARAKARPDILSRIEKEAAKSNGSGPVLLCFTCDPYQPINAYDMLTRDAIVILHKYGYRVNILTKAGTLAAGDFGFLSDKDFFGTTLTFADRQDSLHWEPNAADPINRMEAIREAHELGIPTWVSLEPVIDPQQTLDLIQLAAPFVDEFKVGKFNHVNPLPLSQQDKDRVKEIDWWKFAHDTKDLLEKLGKKYYIKADLRHYLYTPTQGIW